MPQVSSCPEKRTLEKLMLGLIPSGQAETLEEHVTACARCAETLSKLRPADPLVDAVRGVGAQDGARHMEAAKAIIPWLKQIRAREATRTLSSPGEEATLPPASAAAAPVSEYATLPPQSRSEETPDFSPAAAADASTELDAFAFLAPAQAPGEIGRLGPYRVLKPLGAGGMGVVFLAEDPLLKRHIALKVIKPEMVERDDIRERFIAEAQAVAQIEHDNIIAIFQVDEDRGVPYLAMPLLRGQSLEDRLKSVPGPLPLPEILRHSREIAAGLAAAHDKGLVHRDIKPGNVWLETRDEGRAEVRKDPVNRVLTDLGSPFPRVKILDFGLAQAAHDLDMNHGKIVGTPAYMAPEQVQGLATDGRADLFSLGCVMYRMATGESPFKGTDTISTLMNVATTEPPPPRDLNPKVPAPLADLIVKLLAKSPDGRPASAHDVVKAIAAMEEALRPRPSRWRWALLAAAAVLAAVGLTYWLRPKPEPILPIEPGDVAFSYDEPDGRVLLQNGDEPPREIDLKTIQTLSLMPGDYRLSPTSVRVNRELVPDRIVVKPGETTRVELSLVGELATDWHSLAVRGVAVSPVKEKLTVLSVSGKSIHLWNPSNGKDSKDLGRQATDVLCVAISRDGHFALSGTGKGPRTDLSIRLWDLAQGQTADGPGEPMAIFLGHQSLVTALAFAPDGKRFLSGGADGKAFIWDIKAHKPIFSLDRHDGLGIASVAFSPDGKQALTGGGDQLVCLWDAARGSLLKEFKGHTDKVRGVAFSPRDGDEAASASSDGSIRIWNLKTGEARKIDAHKGGVDSLAYSPDGTRLISGGLDEMVRLWDVASGQEIYCFKGHKRAVHSVAYAPDGRRVLSGSADQTVRLWELPR